MWNFAMMKSVIQLMFVLWCGVVTNAQDNRKKRDNCQVPYLFFSTSSGTFSYNTEESTSNPTIFNDRVNALFSFDSINKRLYLRTANNKITSYNLNGSHLTTISIPNVDSFSVDGRNNLIYYYPLRKRRIFVYNITSGQIALVRALSRETGVNDMEMDMTNNYLYIAKDKYPTIIRYHPSDQSFTPLKSATGSAQSLSVDEYDNVIYWVNYDKKSYRVMKSVPNGETIDLNIMYSGEIDVTSDVFNFYVLDKENNRIEQYLKTSLKKQTNVTYNSEKTIGDLIIAYDKDECCVGTFCHVNSTCSDSLGGFNCFCNDGSIHRNGKDCEEPLKKNVTSIVRPSRTAVVGIVNATVMSTPTFHSTTEPLRKNATRFVRPSRTAVVDTVNATVMPAPTFHSTTEPLRKNATSFVRPNRTAVIGTMNATVTSTPTFHSTTERMPSDDSNFVVIIIIVCVAAAAVVLLVVGMKALLSKSTNQGTPHQRLGEAYGQSSEENIELNTKEINDGVVTKLIPAYGGVIDIDGFILKIGPRCLAKDTEITLMKHHDRDFPIRSLLDLDLLEAVPRIIQFLPDGLKFLKPADLTIKFENTVSDCKPFILHGSYRHDYQKTVWELVTSGIEVSNVEGIVNAKINGFSFYSLILTRCGWLDQILSHINQSFMCCAYALYRRTMDTLDISVVILSGFIDDDNGEDIRQLKDHFDIGYVIGEKGVLKPVYTDRRLEMSLHFPGVEKTSFSFDINELQLDSVGFVIDYFKKIAVKSPARGEVKISEVNRSDENESLWRMDICEEGKEQVVVKEPEVQDSKPELGRTNPEPEDANPEPEVVYSNTKLTKGEITRMSRKVGLDWDSLAGLMDIPYSDREKIRVDYPGIRPKAKKVFGLVNDSTFFNRHILVKCFKELGRHDLEEEMLPVEDQNGTILPTLPVITEEDLMHTPLSPREMFRLGRRIVVDWDRLAGLMDIPRADTVDIRYSRIYNDNRSRAEKILAIFNNMEGFSREKLTRCLKEIEQLDLVEPVLTGEWRKL